MSTITLGNAAATGAVLPGGIQSQIFPASNLRLQIVEMNALDDYVLLALPARLRRSITRRQSPRVTVNGRATIEFATGEKPATLFDVSLHGFSIWTSQPAARGEVRLFGLRGPGQVEHWLYAVAAHIGPIPPATEQGCFSGWFVESESSQAFLESIIDELTSASHDPAHATEPAWLQHA